MLRFIFRLVNLFLFSSFLGWWTCSCFLLFFICIYRSVLLFVLFSLPVTFYKGVFVFFYPSQIYIGDGKVPHSCEKKTRLEVYFWMTAVRLVKPLKGHHSNCSCSISSFSSVFHFHLSLCSNIFLNKSVLCSIFRGGHEQIDLRCPKNGPK